MSATKIHIEIESGRWLATWEEHGILFQCLAPSPSEAYGSAIEMQEFFCWEE